MDTELSRQLAAYKQLQKRLSSIKKTKITEDQASTVRDLVLFLNGSNLKSSGKSLSPSSFSTSDLIFIQGVKNRKIHPEIILAMKKSMASIISNPQKGSHLADSKYANLFREKFGIPEGVEEGRIFIMKACVRLRYRLIYAYGGTIKRPLFLAFDHRKDIYKHVGFGNTSS